MRGHLFGYPCLHDSLCSLIMQEHEAHEEGGLVAFWQAAPGGSGDLESGVATPRQVQSICVLKYDMSFLFQAQYVSLCVVC